MNAHADPARLIADATANLADAFSTMELAEDEIRRAIRRRPDRADILYHAFLLLTPRAMGPGMNSEVVYRSHARELLDRVTDGTDTRPATAAELCLVCAQLSLRVPLHSSAAGLYFRMWAQAYPDHPVTGEQAADRVHYERLHGSAIDDLERRLRSKTADPERRLARIDCPGRHHGRPVACRYAASPAVPRDPAS